MDDKKRLLVILGSLICSWLHTHFPGKKWKHGNWHSYCRLCRKGIEKIDGKWYSWADSPDNPTSPLNKRVGREP